jgi:signal transduction histidine kinase
VPSLILQPLVENAIKHGVARKAGPGHIQITARRDGDKLWMEVRDDGVGLSQDGWRTLHKGIGVSTTRERLLRLFGADFRFEFHRHNPGLAVIVALPWRVESSPAGLPLNRADGADTDRHPRGPLSWIAATVRHFALTHRQNRTGYQS